MQQLPEATIDNQEPEPITPDALAARTLDTIPFVMRAIRKLMRAEGQKALSVPQFRALGYIDRHPGASLKAVAEHLGIPDSGASRLVESLVRDGLVSRTANPDDRRQVTLNPLPEGQRLRAQARQHALEGLAETLQRLTSDEREALATALPALQRIFGRNASSTTSETPADEQEPEAPATKQSAPASEVYPS